MIGLIGKLRNAGLVFVIELGFASHASVWLYVPSVHVTGSCVSFQAMCVCVWGGGGGAGLEVGYSGTMTRIFSFLLVWRKIPRRELPRLLIITKLTLNCVSVHGLGYGLSRHFPLFSVGGERGGGI